MPIVSTSYRHLLDVIERVAVPLKNEMPAYPELLNKIGSKRVVLLGEASHGTHEFYRTRAEIAKQLILQKGFMGIAIEGDWPDVYQINRYLFGEIDKTDCTQALAGFKRFPRWMWRNITLLPFLAWLREHNDLQPPQRKVGVYGLDLYSLHASIHAVLNYLESVDPEAAKQAKHRYSCFDHCAVEPQSYGYMVKIGLKHNCIKEVTAQLMDLQHQALRQMRNDEKTVVDEHFYALQNARVVKNAETYYRSLFEGRATSWNIRDQHMMETLNNLMEHLENRWKQPAKVMVWAHNSHLGDARATEMGEQGELNIGQLAKETYPEDAYALGFSTYTGTVTAASGWDQPPECKRVNPGLPESYEELFHHVAYPDFFLSLTDSTKLQEMLSPSRLQRAIGVIYLPETERISHYFFTHLPQQFDAIIHFDQTTALEPLDKPPEWRQQELAEMYPTEF